MPPTEVRASIERSTPMLSPQFTLQEPPKVTALRAKASARRSELWAEMDKVGSDLPASVRQELRTLERIFQQIDKGSESADSKAFALADTLWGAA